MSPKSSVCIPANDVCKPKKHACAYDQEDFQDFTISSVSQPMSEASHKPKVVLSRKELLSRKEGLIWRITSHGSGCTDSMRSKSAATAFIFGVLVAVFLTHFYCFVVASVVSVHVLLFA